MATVVYYCYLERHAAMGQAMARYCCSTAEIMCMRLPDISPTSVLTTANVTMLALLANLSSTSGDDVS